ncbi:uncharacterized protein LOC108198244 [Daucus carota subsp. sativus]|uniref:uncharacterized protein LOC108198244 n=1 Tax=Daucus carota subsp. sativus TaxID=79200 RepID=UPI0007EF4DCA|nr:PREDICTED: single-stranded DNA-binding protein 3-like [Daucus carota subsp. sativus]
MDFGDKDTHRMLMLYIHDHMRKNNMHEAAKIFAEEANLELNPVIDAPQGFLAEWWEVFWNKYFSIYSNIPGCEDISRDASTLHTSFVLPTPGFSKGMTAGTLLQNIFPRFTSISTMSQQLVGNTSHCKGKDSVMEPSPSVFVPTPGIDGPWFENSMPNVSGTSHQQQQASTQSSLLVSGVASNQNSEGRFSSQMEPTLQVPGLNSPSTGSRNPSAGAFDFFKYYFHD